MIFSLIFPATQLPEVQSGGAEVTGGVFVQFNLILLYFDLTCQLYDVCPKYKAVGQRLFGVYLFNSI